MIQYLRPLSPPATPTSRPTARASHRPLNSQLHPGELSTNPLETIRRPRASACQNFAPVALATTTWASPPATPGSVPSRALPFHSLVPHWTWPNTYPKTMSTPELPIRISLTRPSSRSRFPSPSSRRMTRQRCMPNGTLGPSNPCYQSYTNLISCNCSTTSTTNDISAVRPSLSWCIWS